MDDIHWAEIHLSPNHGPFVQVSHFRTYRGLTIVTTCIQVVDHSIKDLDIFQSYLSQMEAYSRQEWIRITYSFKEREISGIHVHRSETHSPEALLHFYPGMEDIYLADMPLSRNRRTFVAKSHSWSCRRVTCVPTCVLVVDHSVKDRIPTNSNHICYYRKLTVLKNE